MHCHRAVGDVARAGLPSADDVVHCVIPYAAGARQINVTFDPGFTSCTASVIEGHSGGTIRRRGPNGMMVSSATTSPPRCSIQSGNAFAGQ